MIDWTDWVLWVIYFSLFYLILRLYKASKAHVLAYKWFLKGFLLKILGGVIFALVSVFYYRGDTVLFFDGATKLVDFFLESPSQYLRLLWSQDIQSQFATVVNDIDYSGSEREWLMVKILSVLCLFSFNSYLVLTLFTSVISFWGAWKLFKVFSDILPKAQHVSFIIIFLTPSVMFWGTGILKDTFTLAFSNYLVYAIYKMTENRAFSLSILSMSIAAAIVIYYLKSYILLAFLPSVVYIIYLFFKNAIRAAVIRILVLPFLFLTLFFAGFFALQSLSENTVYSAANIKVHVRGFHTTHIATRDGGGSSYDLGDVDLTAVGAFKKIPAALNVTFFRPYLWEVKSITSFLGAAESTVVTVFFIMVLVRVKFGFMKVLKTSKILLGLFLFILIFGFAVGFTSYNFGALSRFKMPITSLYLFTLLYVYLKSKPQSAKDLS